MDMRLSRRGVMGALATLAVPATMSVAVGQEKEKPTSSAPAAKGKLTDQTLGALLKAMGLEAKAAEQRYDFAFKATIEDAEWELSMSAVLSQDASSIWIMAWLDELPKSAADVPRTALLRLLSDNDKLGKGKFFAYIAANRRFVLQRVIPNENITAAGFRAALDDLGQTVVQHHAHWSVSNWSSSTGEEPAAKSAPPVKGSAPQSATPATTGTIAKQPTTGSTTSKSPQSATNDSKFGGASKR